MNIGQVLFGAQKVTKSTHVFSLDPNLIKLFHGLVARALNQKWRTEIETVKSSIEFSTNQIKCGKATLVFNGHIDVNGRIFSYEDISLAIDYFLDAI